MRKLLSHFKNKKILILGDLILDEFLWGEVSRICPEAPVPVVEVLSKTPVPGGAANVANNVNSLGGKALVSGIIGDDDVGEALKERLKEKNIEVKGIIIDKKRPTTLKTRIIAHSQQVVRIDYEKINPIDNFLAQKMLNYVLKVVAGIEAIIISDYSKGVFGPILLKEVISLGRKYHKSIIIDPSPKNFLSYKYATVITPNHHQAGEILGRRLKDKKDILKAGKNILAQIESEAVLITRGEEGMSLFERNGKVIHIPTAAREVYDVTGAGDTVVGAFTLALVSGANFREAAHIANQAAGIVVGKVGTATVTREELKNSLKEE